MDRPAADLVPHYEYIPYPCEWWLGNVATSFNSTNR